MAVKKKVEKKETLSKEKPKVKEKLLGDLVKPDKEAKEKVEKVIEEVVEDIKKPDEPKKEGKFKVGNIVFVSKGAETDLEGIKLFPQYKNYTYTVEAYDEKSGVYTIRTLNLLLRLKEKDLVAPEERGDSILDRIRY